MIELLPKQAAQPYGIVYLARNTVNGKGYVGQTVKALKARMREHRHEANARRSKSCFYAAVRKYGFELFTWQALKACGSREDLAAAEQVYISTMKTKVPNGYNLTDGGGGTSGYVMSTEQKRKISEAQMGNTHCKGVFPSVETRRKISEAGMGRVCSVETRLKLGEASKGNTHCKGKVCSVETRRKLSEANKGHVSWTKGKVLSAEHKQKLSKAGMGNTHRKGKVHSAETKQKISESLKRRRKSMR